MIDMDIHDKRLQQQASYLAMKNGHQLTIWEPDTIVYGNRRKNNQKFVDTYASACKHCGMTVEIAAGLEDQMQGEVLTEACMMNTGYEDRVMRGFDNKDCAFIVRINHDTRTAYLRECA